MRQSYLRSLALWSILAVAGGRSPEVEHAAYAQEPLHVLEHRISMIKDAFQTAWAGYYTHAFPADELLPMSNGRGNSRNGWGASAIDALSTAILMDKQDVVDQIINHIPTINWHDSHDKQPVNVFETTIRYLGGLLSAYDLLSGPYHHPRYSQNTLDGLLQQAKSLADNMSFAFETQSGIPTNTIMMHNRSDVGDGKTVLAAAGSLVLEWTRLADLSGNQTYAELADRAEQHLLQPQPASCEPWPGLVGTYVNVTTGEFMDARGGWSGWDDSFYEYLIKMYAYDPKRFEQYRKRWVLAADSSMQHLASHPKVRPELTFLANFNGTRLVTASGHLACFDGGNFVLGGLVLEQKEYVDFGLELVDSCAAVYNQTVTGIGPESFSWDVVDPEAFDSTQLELYRKAGFVNNNGRYLLRPEMLESFYYAYRATGGVKYQEWSWRATEAILRECRVGSGYAELLDVNTRDGTRHVDFQESYWFAETLKYAYLIHADKAKVHVLQARDQSYVFNTEGHPMRTCANKQ